jgi:hypothetical protein
MTASVDLYWLPLGAGGRSVRVNGVVFERLSAVAQRRAPRDLYHSALEVRLGAQRHVIEMAPAWAERSAERGVVAEGSVGMRRAGRLRLFRYEIRCWRDGRIPDVAEAVASPRCMTRDPAAAGQLLDLVVCVPTQVWGRDELGTGDMWNSNSVVSWLLARCGLDAAAVDPPAGGRAPGWAAGLIAAQRPLRAASDAGPPRRSAATPTH